MRLLVTSAVLLSACTSPAPVNDPGPPGPEGWDPDGPDVLVTYTRALTDEEPVPVGIEVTSAGAVGWSRVGSEGCGAIDYPWSLSIGPAEGDRSGYREILTSGSALTGKMTVSIEVSDEGVTVGWGRPDWAFGDMSAQCDPR